MVVVNYKTFVICKQFEDSQCEKVVSKRDKNHQQTKKCKKEEQTLETRCLLPEFVWTTIASLVRH